MKNLGHFNAEEKLGIPRDNRKLFGSGQTILQIKTIDLTNALVNEEIDFGAANFIWAIDATDDVSTISLAFNTQKSGLVPFTKGQVISGVPFAKTFATSVAQSGKSITFVYGFSDNPVEFLNAVESSGTINITKADILTDNSDISALATAKTALVLADTTRREVFIQNKDASSAVTIGAALTVTATRGIILEAGQTMILSSTAAISVFNATGTAVDIGIMETFD